MFCLQNTGTVFERESVPGPGKSLHHLWGKGFENLNLIDLDLELLKGVDSSAGPACDLPRGKPGGRMQCGWPGSTFTLQEAWCNIEGCCTCSRTKSTFSSIQGDLVTVHPIHERDPVPLAVHHHPVTTTFAMFQVCFYLKIFKFSFLWHFSFPVLILRWLEVLRHWQFVSLGDLRRMLWWGKWSLGSMLTGRSAPFIWPDR